MKAVKTYLALGDSYTIGEAVPAAESFPYQLQDALVKRGHSVESLKIIAQTGWTTAELQAAIAAETVHPPYDLVTLLIGVNNQYRGYSVVNYRVEFEQLLRQAIVFAGEDTDRVRVLSIPDWGVTPFAQKEGRSPEKIAREIDSFNEAAQEISENLGVVFMNSTPHSRLAATDLSLLASDGLHPSGKMYAQWVQSLLS
ncbi:MAG: SGNH/GDSL hydrolase family protein [Sphingobacteriaceae bacterium]